MPTPQDIFGPDGELAQRLAGFRHRPPQQRMAELVEQAISESRHAVIEAGTGVGKTYAYLIPVLSSGCRTIVSTGTRTLQDQLYERDLPSLGEILGRPVDVAVLKGRANYLCRHRLAVALERAGTRGEQLDRLRALDAWARETGVGDLAELDAVEDDFRLKLAVTSTADNCLGSRCEDFDDCFVGQARRCAQAARIVVVNHHLLLADLALKDQGFGELLPSADVVVVDEAHSLPDIAQQFFGTSMSTREVERLGADIEDEATIRKERSLAEDGRALWRAGREVRARAGRQQGRIPWFSESSALSVPLGELQVALRNIAAVLDPFEDDAGLARCGERANALLERLDSTIDTNAHEGLRWLEVAERSVTVNFTPFDIADALGARISAQRGTWVFASATLAVGQDFDHFTSRIGVPVPIEAALPSPFDFRSNGRIYLPDGLPDPSEPDHTKFFLDCVVPLIRATAGGAFVLFTSYRALNAAERLLDGVDLGGELLVQGHGPRTRLLERFREAGNATLLGTGSFWQGVDVRGPALRVVAIDKLPFAVPNDPVVQARIEAIRREGGEPFHQYQLPQAVLALKQGVGRLIRDFDDRGIVVLGDPRLRTRSYGQTFLASLPPMPIVSEPAAAMAFARSLVADAVGGGQLDATGVA